MKVLVFGKNGQLARALASQEPSWVFLSSQACDLSEPSRSTIELERYDPDLVINAAAYTQVDQAEREAELAFRINAQAPKFMAEYCARKGKPFLHFSTDYVFDGTGASARDEQAATAPLNTYGRSKLEGENLILASKCRGAIFRTSWVYAAEGKNFVRTMLKLGAERESLRVVADQIGSPTNAADLAAWVLCAIPAILHDPRPVEIFHAANSGETSWHGFAAEIFRFARAVGMPLKVERVEPISTADYPTPARRPLNSRLDTRKLQSRFGISPRSWQASLKDCIESICSLRSLAT